MITEDYRPFSYLEDGKLEGFGVEIVKLIQDRLNDDAAIKVYPWARGYNQTLKKRTRPCS
ncbi:MAG: transporter substrate-binding domain-containing protein [Rhodospirillaceae bacterium]|nr:transporter substrate-binding domain-containing protein [Rhodospirillaceae bacterium]